MMDQPTAGPQRSGPLSLIRWILLFAGLGLLVAAQLLINVAQWYEWDLSRFLFLHRWGCRVFPASCSTLSLPRFFVPAVAAAVVGTGLFLLARGLSRPSPLLHDLPAGDLSLRGLRTYRRLSLAAIVLGLLLELVGLGIALSGRLAPVWLWAGGLLALVAGLAYEDRRTGTSPLLHRRDIIYLSGVLAFLVAAAAAGGGRWIVAMLSGLLSAGGLISFARLYRHHLNRRDRIERVAVPLVALLALAFAAYGLTSWRWSLVGDEYNFFNMARDILNGVSDHYVLSGAGVDERHPLLSSYLQALSMRLFGANAYGWRVASPLLVAFSVFPLYYFARQSSSRPVALIAVSVFAGSHYLMTFAKIGYNSVQAIFPFALSLGLFALARRRGSLFGFFLLGVALGAGFYTYAISRLILLPIGILFLLYYPPHERRSWYLYAVTASGFVLTAYPVVLDRRAWQGQASKSILQSEVAHTLGGKIVQARDNVLYGTFAFLTHLRDSHFVFGAHLDPIGGILLLLGLGVVLYHLCASRIHLAWFLGCLAVLVATSGLQPYDYPVNTWLWFNLPTYALLIAVGGYAFARILAALLCRPWWAYVLSSALVLVMLPLNFWLSVDLSQQKTTKNELAFVLETAQNVRDQDGRGPTLHVIGRKDFHEPLLGYMFAAYEIPRERFALHYHPTDVEETIGQLCDSRASPAVLLVSEDYPDRGTIKRRMDECWPDAQVHRLVDGTGIPRFLRFMTLSASSGADRGTLVRFPEVTTELTPVVTSGDRIERQSWQVFEPLDVAVAADGLIAAIDGVTEELILLEPNGDTRLTLDAGFKELSSLAFASDGSLVLLDNGQQNPIVTIGSDATVRGQVGSDAGLYSPRGIDIPAGGPIYVADTGGERVVRVSLAGEVLAEFLGSGTLSQPTDVAVLPDDRLVVTDPSGPALYMLGMDDRVLWSLPLAPSNTTVAPKVAVSGRSWLTVSDPGAGRVLRVSLEGRVLQEWTGLATPTGVAVAQDGTIYVAETGRDRISRLHPAP